MIYFFTLCTFCSMYTFGRWTGLVLPNDLTCRLAHIISFYTFSIYGTHF